MRSVQMPGVTDSDILLLKKEGTENILSSMKAFLKSQKKILLNDKVCATTETKQLHQLLEGLHEYLKLLEVPYPSNVVSAGVSYFFNRKKHIQSGAEAVYQITDVAIPKMAALMRELTVNDEVMCLLSFMLKHLMAFQLVEESRQASIHADEAGKIDKMAYKILQEQEPKMTFSAVANLLIKPMINVFHEKLSACQKVPKNVPCTF